MKPRTNRMLTGVNLLDLKPSRNLHWLMADNNLVVLLLPKFKHPLLVRWLLPFLKNPNFKIKLDRYGSFIWTNCDGDTTVHEIAARLKLQFGDAVDPVYDRIAMFMSQLRKNEFILLKEIS